MSHVTRREMLKGLAGISVGALGASVLAACGATPTPQVIEKVVTSVVEKEVTKIVAGTPQVVKETVVVEKPIEAAQPTEIEWWPGWPGPYMLAIAKLFEDKNPDIKLKVVSNYPEMQAVLAAVASGTPPDIIADVPYTELIVRDTLLPLDDMINTSTEVSLTDGDIPTQLWEAFAWEGKHYGVPSVDTAGREGMGFNLNLIEEAGLDSTNLPTTWEDVLAWHEKITKLDSAGNIEVIGMAPMAERTPACSYGDPWMWPQMWGFHYIKELKYDIDRPETVEFLKVIKAFYDTVGVEKVQSLQSALEGITRGAFGVGKQAMQITYPSGPAAVWQVNPTHNYKFTYVPVPASRKGVTMQTAAGHAGVVMKGSKAPEAAFKLAVFLTQKEACDVLLDQVGWVGPRKSWQATMDLGKYPDLVQANILFFTNSLTEAKETWVDIDPIDGICESEWNKAWQGVVYGDLTPEQAAQQMQANMTAELENVLRKQG